MIAVIGIDAQFGAQANIDQVERAFYQGFALSNDRAINGDVATICRASVERMAQANRLNLNEITLVVVDSSNQPIADRLSHIMQACFVVPTLAQALTVSHLLVKQGKTVALLGVNLGASPSTLQKNTISFDHSFESYAKVDGVAGLLLTNEQSGAYVYSTITGFDADSDITTATKNALSHAGIAAEQVGLLEVSALADKTLAQQERDGLINAYQSSERLHTAIGCARGVTGEGVGFSSVAGLLKTVISLHQRYIPAVSGWQQVADGDLPLWQSSAFYFPVEARPWFPHANGDAHVGAYSCQTENAYCHVVLQENQSDTQRSNGFIASSALKLFLLGGESESQLLDAIATLESQADQPLDTLAHHCFEQYKDSPNVRYRLSILADSSKALGREIKMAKVGVANAFADVANNVPHGKETRSGEWETPKGSYFSAHPVTGANNIAFLYPGIGATYLGLGRDLFHLFPQIYQPVAELADDISETLKDTRLNPRSINRLDVKTLTKLDLALRFDLANIAECGVGFACVFTKVFEDVFALKADYATGYSMGEVSMYAALGCWQQPGLLSARLAQSDTFNHQLCGELLSLQEQWDLSNVTPSANTDKIWETYTVKTTIDKVSVALEGEDRVYCTIVNTPDSLLLGGYPADCERVIAKNGWWAMPLNMANAIHSQPAQREYDHMVELHTMAVTDKIDTKMYSSSCYLPIPQRSKAIAHSVAKCLCDRVDYPRLINTLYDKGARVFMEIGPGKSLCRWATRTLDFNVPAGDSSGKRSGDSLGKSAYATIPVNAKGTSDELNTLRALARLASHGVTLDLDSLFNGSIVVQQH
ncbi:MAG: PfaB family protein [Alteromonadaceae bacterium]|jgi:PfaB family protein